MHLLLPILLYKIKLLEQYQITGSSLGYYRNIYIIEKVFDAVEKINKGIYMLQNLNKLLVFSLQIVSSVSECTIYNKRVYTCCCKKVCKWHSRIAWQRTNRIFMFCIYNSVTSRNILQRCAFCLVSRLKTYKDNNHAIAVIIAKNVNIITSRTKNFRRIFFISYSHPK